MSDIYIKGVNDNNPQYQEFIKVYTGKGGLKIRAYGANEAIPISGLKVVVSTVYNNNKFIFFDGYTDDSGMIERLELPTPAANMNDLVVPDTISYSIDALFEPDKSEKIFNVNLYDGICVLQNIGIIPNLKERKYGD